MTIEILKSTARLDDEDGKERFLATIGSDAEGLRAQLKPGRMAHLEQYEKEAQTARYLKMDGVSYVCFIVVGVSLDDARRIAIASHDIQAWSTAEFRKAVDRCNDVDAASRSITDASLKASEMLSAIETAVFNVKPVGLERVEADPKANFHEIISTIELLFELLPKRLQRSAAPAAM